MLLWRWISSILAIIEFIGKCKGGYSCTVNNNQLYITIISTRYNHFIPIVGVGKSGVH